MPETLFNQEQTDWIREHIKGRSAYELLPEINKQFGLKITPAQFKGWRSRNKIFGERISPNKGKFLYPKEITDFIVEHKNDYEAAYMAELIEKQFSVKITAKYVKSWKNNRHLHGTLTGAYNEHRPHPHKGDKGWCIPNGENTRFKTGKESLTKAPLLAVRRRPGAHNYSFIKIAEPDKWQPYEVYLMEQHLGRKLQKGEKVKFLDGDVTNFDMSNLMLIDNHVQGKCMNKNRYTKDPELTKAGILLSKIEIKLEEKTNAKCRIQ